MPIALLAAACSVSSGSGPDAGPGPGEDGGGPGGDGAAGAAGLVLEFRGVPQLEAALVGDFPADLKRVRIDLENVRAVGDAAPGDARTTRDQLRLEWWGASDDDDGAEPANNEPVLVSFDQAPPGLYSNVYAELVAYRLEGEVSVGDPDYDFRIDDRPATPLAISISLGGVTLEAGETRQVAIDVSYGPVVTETRWDEVTPDGDGKLIVTSSSPQIGGIREKMDAAFGYQSDGEVSSGAL